MFLNPNRLFKGHPSQFLKIFFDFSYYICISPYRFVIEKDGTISTIQWTPQKIICFIIHLLSILHIVLYRWKKLVPAIETKESPEKYFFILSHLCSHFLTIVTFKRVWLNRKEFANILSLLCERNSKLQYSNNGFSNNSLVSRSRRASYVGKITAKRFCGEVWKGFFFKIVCLGYLLASGFYADFQLLDPLECWHNPWPWENTKLLRETKDIFGYWMFWGLPEAAWATNILTILMCLSAVTRGMTRYLGNLLLVSGVLTLWNVVHQSVDYLQSIDPLLNGKDANEDHPPTFRMINKSNLSIIPPSSILPSDKSSKLDMENNENNQTANWVVVYGKYLKIRNLVRRINIAFGPIVIMSMARAIIYNSANMDDALHQRTRTVGKVLMIMLTVNDIVVFLLAADVSSQMDNFRQWISNDENRKYAPMDQVHVVLQELNAGTIGIRGGSLFCITYSLLWNALTTVMTYFIIFVQTKLGKEQHLNHDGQSRIKI